MDYPELKATPVKRNWAMSVANALRKGRDIGNKVDIPVLGGLGDVFIGQSPEGFERVAYDEPLTTGKGWTTKLRPEAIDMGFLALDAAPVARMATRGAAKAATKGSDRLVQAIMKNKDVTGMDAIKAAGELSPVKNIVSKSTALATEQLPDGIAVKKSEMGINKLSDPSEYQRALDAITNYTGDPSRAKSNLDYFKNEVDTLLNKGGKAYRVLFADSPASINTANFGEHWVTDPSYLDSISENLRNKFGKGKNAYIVEANMPSGVVTNRGVDYHGNPEEFEIGMVPDRSGVSYRLFDSPNGYRTGNLIGEYPAKVKK